MSGWLLICECGHTSGVHGYRDVAGVMCLDADCGCRVWTPENMMWVEGGSER